MTQLVDLPLMKNHPVGQLSLNPAMPLCTVLSSCQRQLCSGNSWHNLHTFLRITRFNLWFRYIKQKNKNCHLGVKENGLRHSKLRCSDIKPMLSLKLKCSGKGICVCGGMKTVSFFRVCVRSCHYTSY